MLGVGWVKPQVKVEGLRAGKGWGWQGWQGVLNKWWAVDSARGGVRLSKLTRIKSRSAGGWGLSYPVDNQPGGLSFAADLYCTPQINIFPKV